MADELAEEFGGGFGFGRQNARFVFWSFRGLEPGFQFSAIKITVNGLACGVGASRKLQFPISVFRSRGQRQKPRFRHRAACLLSFFVLPFRNVEKAKRQNDYASIDGGFFLDAGSLVADQAEKFISGLVREPADEDVRPWEFTGCERIARKTGMVDQSTHMITPPTRSTAVMDLLLKTMFSYIRIIALTH